MITTGIKYREIYPQELINWSAKLIVPYTTGNFSISYSGVGGVFDAVKLTNGKIFNHYNEMVDTYQSRQPIYLSGNISSLTADLYRDNKLLYMGMPKPYESNISRVYVNNLSNSYVDLENLTIMGKSPSIVFGSGVYSKYIIYGSGDSITYTIVNNNDYPIILNSGSTSNSNFIITGINDLAIDANSSGNFYIKNVLFLPSTVQQVPIRLFTNGGNEQINVWVSGKALVNNDYYIYLSRADGANSLIEQGAPTSYNILYQNYDGIDISISLEHVSGITGEYYKKIETGRMLQNILISGFISGTGIVSQHLSGVISGYNNFTSGFDYATGIGLITGSGYASDELVSINYRVPLTGLGVASLRNGSTIQNATGVFYVNGSTEGMSSMGIYSYNSPIVRSALDVAENCETLPKYILPINVFATAELGIIPDNFNNFEGISIADQELVYHENQQDYPPPKYFNDITSLVNNLNNNSYYKYASGFISNNTGLNLVSKISGLDGNFIPINIIGNSNAFVINRQFSGGDYYLADLFPTGSFSGNINVNKKVTGIYQVTGIGYISGYVDQLQSGIREFTGAWDIETGILNVYNNFANNNFLSGNAYYSRIRSLDDTLPSVIGISLLYTNVMSTLSIEPLDVAKLTISGINFGENGSGLSVYLTGVK